MSQSNIPNSWEDLNEVEEKKDVKRTKKTEIKHIQTTQPSQKKITQKLHKDLIPREIVVKDIEVYNKTNDYHRRKAVDNKFAAHKVGYKIWDMIANSSTEWERKLWTGIYMQAKENTNVQSQLHVIGEEMYLEIRQKLSDYLKLQVHNGTHGVDKKNKKSKSKKDAIIEANISEQVTSESKSLEECVNKYFELNCNYKYVECNMLKLMIMLQILCKEYSSDKTNVALEKCLFEYIFTLCKYHNAAINVKKEHDKLSETCINDLYYCIQRAIVLCKFDVSDVVKTYPQWIFRTSYEKIMTTLHINNNKPNHSQMEILDWCKLNKSGLLLVHSMMGSGKTTAVDAIAGYLNSNAGDTRKLLYTCPNMATCIEVCKMLYANHLAFAIVIYDNRTNTLEYKHSMFANSKTSKAATKLFVCDVFVARIILEQRYDIMHQHLNYINRGERVPDDLQKIPEYILIGDELTKDSDNIKNFESTAPWSVHTEWFVSLMQVAPSTTILMSATLPKYESLKEFYDEIAGDKKVDVVTTTESKVGCNLILQDGTTWLPHSHCRSRSDVSRLKQRLIECPFLGRYYTFDALLHLMKTYPGIKTRDLNILLNSPCAQSEIQKMCLDILDQLKDSDLGEAKTFQNGAAIQLHNFYTANADKFCTSDQCTIVYTSTPVKTALENYETNFGTDVWNFTKIKTILDDYESKMSKYKSEEQRLLSQIEEEGTSKKKKQVNGNNGSFEKADTLLRELYKNIPTWNFPKVYQLGSNAFMREYKCEGKNNITISVTDLPKDSHVSNKILTLLASGIGIYDTTDDSLDDSYLETVLSLIKRKLLRILYSNNSIAYGTNLSVGSIIFNDHSSDKLLETCSMNTIYQMGGRAGRGGELSHRADVYTTSPDNRLVQKMTQYIVGTLDEGDKDECSNILRCYNVLC
jgi:hypothetical protein